MNDTSEEKPSDRFRTMAAAIDHNANSTFGGAAVIIPPDNSGSPIELLMLDAQANPAQFWSTIKSRIDIILAELDEKQRNLTGFGQRR